jgi:cytochrome P450
VRYRVLTTFRLAGRDTTSQLLTWCMYLLSQHRDIEAKVSCWHYCYLTKIQVLEEIKSTLQGATPTYENTKNMKYLKAVLDETLRYKQP